MSADLDRAYVINGDDLRIALSGGVATGMPQLVPNPRDVAEFILDRYAQTLEGVLADREAARLQEAQCRSEGARCDREGGPCTCPCLPVPDDEPDAELAAMAVIVSALDALDNAEVTRVLRWACDRYGT